VSKRVTPALERGYFSAIGLSSVKAVADRHKQAAYRNKHWSCVFNGIKTLTLNELEPLK